MTARRLARFAIRCSAFVVPGDYRRRWREEWLAEAHHGRRPLSRAMGAPWDAALLRGAELTGALRTGWLADARDAVRALRRTPIQTLAIVVCLSLGSVLGGGVLNAMVGGELPGIRDRGRLVRLGAERAGEPRPGHLIGAEHRALPDVIPGLAGWGAEYGSKSTYFSVLGTTAALGRLIQPADDRPEAPPVVVIGYAFWQRHFGGHADALGSTLRFGTGTYAIVGVTPPAFTGVFGGDLERPASERGQLWPPMAQTAAVGLGVGHDSGTGPGIIGRLAPGLSRDIAESQGQAAVSRLNAAREASAYAGSLDTIVAIRLLPFRMSIVDDDEPAAIAALVAVLAGVPLIVLGIGCATVAGIQLARAIGRTHELAVRTSLGASRLRIARMLAIETGLAAVAAAAVAWLVGRVLLQWSAAVLPIAPIADRRLLFFAAVLPLAITLIAGLLPAWRATGLDVLAGLRTHARVGRAASARLRRTVVAAQMTLSVALLVTAAALTTGLTNLASTVGPMHDDVLTAEVAFADLGFDEDRQRQARAAIVNRVRGIPGVESIAISPSRLFRGSGGDGSCWPRSGPRPQNVALWELTRMVTPEYFDRRPSTPSSSRTTLSVR
jgi:cell division protein FtsX